MALLSKHLNPFEQWWYACFSFAECDLRREFGFFEVRLDEVEELDTVRAPSQKWV